MSDETSCNVRISEQKDGIKYDDIGEERVPSMSNMI